MFRHFECWILLLLLLIMTVCKTISNYGFFARFIKKIENYFSYWIFLTLLFFILNIFIGFESGVYSRYEFCYNLNLYFLFSYFFHTLILYLAAYFVGFSRSWYWQPLKNTIWLFSTSDFDRFLESISDNLDRFGHHNLDICNGKVHFYIFVFMYLHIWTRQL